MFEPVLMNNIAIPGIVGIDVYMKHGGYESLRKVLTQNEPDEVIEIVKRSGIRGRGGAGFPCGVKWGFVPKDSPKPKYLLCNADEGEPGTFKDREIIHKDPHSMLEGMAIACYAIGAHAAYVYIRGEFHDGASLLEESIADCYEKGVLGKGILGTSFDLDMYVHRGAGAYICGEETALIESIEGKRGHPRLKPPFPAVVGLFGCPTVVNNVETLAYLRHIVERGPEWFAAIGTERNTGPKLYAVSGHVNRPGVYELPMGIPLRELIFDHAGGVPGDRAVKAVIPGGASCPILSADELDVHMDFDSLARIGSMLGSAATIVMDETTCMVEVAYRISQFFTHESCGQCTPCREGTIWMTRILESFENGTGTEKDLKYLEDVARNIGGNTICPFGDGAIAPVLSTIAKFRDEYMHHIEHKKCAVRGDFLPALDEAIEAPRC